MKKKMKCHGNGGSIKAKSGKFIPKKTKSGKDNPAWKAANVAKQNKNG